ncbi:hypothetical protein HMPREF0208_03924 [Citrobacter koseri]|nr:hypothetical protein HMPREF0208_03924 [Citrobacter koseri]
MRYRWKKWPVSTRLIAARKTRVRTIHIPVLNRNLREHSYD